jgi:hypothetical protein
MLEELLANDTAQLESKTTVYQEQEQVQEKLQEEYKEIDVQIRSKIDAGDAIKVSFYDTYMYTKVIFYRKLNLFCRIDEYNILFIAYPK